MAETHSLQDMRQQAAITAKVFIQRDYSSGTMCQFQTKFPSELENRIDKQQFEETVRALNNMYAEAEKLGSQSYIEGCLACLTAYTVFLCMETHYEKQLLGCAELQGLQHSVSGAHLPRGIPRPGTLILRLYNLSSLSYACSIHMTRFEMLCLTGFSIISCLSVTIDEAGIKVLYACIQLTPVSS
uniref:Golgin subfamily A member 7 n=1 Tax=Astatotilapia calliptera TaxID=8154 RepID=A0AAX7T750_ASTCA